MSAWSLLSHDFDSWSQNLSKVYTLNSKMSFQRGEKFKEEEDITSEIFQVASLLVYTHRYRHIRVEDFRVLFSIRYILKYFRFSYISTQIIRKNIDKGFFLSQISHLNFLFWEWSISVIWNDMKISNSDRQFVVKYCIIITFFLYLTVIFWYTNNKFFFNLIFQQ